MSQGLTKEHFDSVIQSLRGNIHGLRETVATKKDVRAVIQHFNKSQGYQNERMDREFGSVSDKLEVINVKLDALMREPAVRKELHNLVDELHDKGVAVDSGRVFLS